MLVQGAKHCASRLVKRKVCGEVFRWNSTRMTNKIVPAADFKMTSASKEEKQSFTRYYPALITNLMDSMKGKNLPEMMKWYPYMLDYNLLDGKKRRGLTLVMSYKLLKYPKKLSEENIRLTNFLGGTTEMGQVMDHLSDRQAHQNLKHFTMDRYKTIASTKFGTIAFSLPVQAAMYLAGIQDPELQRKTAALLQEMGMFLPIKNDYLDCFGNLDTNGATLYGDIREGMCMATLAKATPEQRVIMDQCYGHPDEQSIKSVMEVYRALDIPALFASFTNMRDQLEQMDCTLPKKVFYNILYNFDIDI